ncbi:MAG: helix-turn-helix transcriptional regulator [Eubacteriales bacterium]|nr:helix-turn-helix transcriptional regulator [Eubacteriales bacterium]
MSDVGWRQVATISEYMEIWPAAMHFALSKPEPLSPFVLNYRMIPEFGSGYVRSIALAGGNLQVLIADFTPQSTLEKFMLIEESFIEIGCFESDSTVFSSQHKREEAVVPGVYCYVNKAKMSCACSEAKRPVRFTKIALTKTYFNEQLSERLGMSYADLERSDTYFRRRSELPELNFIFQQIRDCRAEGETLMLYLESKIMELIAIVVDGLKNPERVGRGISVRLDRRDIRRLGKTVTYMKNNLASYPSHEQLAKLALMSTSRYCLAFKQCYGTTPYEYLKLMRMNRALLLLKERDCKISEVASRLGYQHAGHFASIFREYYGVSPSQYRRLYV